MHDYKTVIISMTKLVAWHSAKGITGLPCLFVVEWDDYIAYSEIDDFVSHGDFRISKKSNNRRNDYDDQEVVAYYLTERFKILEKKDVQSNKPTASWP